MRVVYRVHCNASNRRPYPAPALCTGFTEFAVNPDGAIRPNEAAFGLYVFDVSLALALMQDTASAGASYYGLPDYWIRSQITRLMTKLDQEISPIGRVPVRSPHAEGQPARPRMRQLPHGRLGSWSRWCFLLINHFF